MNTPRNYPDSESMVRSLDEAHLGLSEHERAHLDACIVRLLGSRLGDPDAFAACIQSVRETVIRERPAKTA